MQGILIQLDNFIWGFIITSFYAVKYSLIFEHDGILFGNSIIISLTSRLPTVVCSQEIYDNYITSCIFFFNHGIDCM